MSSSASEAEAGEKQQNAMTAELSDGAMDGAKISKPRLYMLTLGFCLGLFMAMVDSSIVATSLYTIGTEFNDLQKINWAALAYTLAFVGCVVLFARVSDIIGRRDAFIAAFALFFAASLGCGFSNNLPSLIACRVLQGIGGGGLYSITMIALPEVTPLDMRPFLASMVGIVIIIGGVLGPVLGGVLTHDATWRWVFWINGPICTVSMVLFYLSWPKPEYLPQMPRRSWGDLDIVGSFLLIAGSVMFVFAFQYAGENSLDPWNKAAFIAPLIFGLVCCTGVFGWAYIFERRWPNKMSTLPLLLFRNRVFACGVASTLVLGFPYLAALYAIPLRLQVVNGKSALVAGVMLLPMLGAGGFGSIVSGVINKTKNRMFECITGGALLVTLGCALETTVSDSPDLEPKSLGFLVFIGFGFGIVAASVTILTNAEAPLHEAAPAQGIIAQTRILGGSIGIALTSVVLATQQRNQLASVPPLTQDGSVQLTPGQYAMVRKAYNDAYTETMVICAIMAGLAALISLGTWRRDRIDFLQMRANQRDAEIERRKMLAEVKACPAPGV